MKSFSDPYSFQPIGGSQDETALSLSPRHKPRQYSAPTVHPAPQFGSRPSPVPLIDSSSES